MINRHYAKQTPATTGAISELKVAVDLLSIGYHIFRAESPSCPCDLIALKNGKIFAVEVRTIARNRSGTIPKSAYTGKENGAVNCFAFVFKDDSEDIIYHTQYGKPMAM